MKTMKRALALVLALSMVLALGLTTVLAAGETAGVNNDSGKITIDNAVVGQTYTVYQILKLESYDADANAYAYKAADNWASFINGNDIKGPYVSVDEQGYVTWVDGANAAAFAKLAQDYAAKNTIGNEGAKKADSATVEFTGLNLGYYLVDSTLGTLCSLDTTNPTVTIKEKNVVPTNVKTVKEDSTGSYGESNDADIGQTVNFKSTITAQAGAQNYVFHDTMSSGLSFTGAENVSVTLNSTLITAGNATYTVVAEKLTDGCTFEVRFTQAFCDTLNANDQIVISYSAVLNEDAVIAGDGNSNESKLTYGDEGKTETKPSVTKTYTWKMDVLKHNADGVGLAGAKFVLSRTTDKKNAIKLIAVPNKETPKTPTYRVAKADETENVITEIETDGTGKFTITGLDSDTYYLIETSAPAGYNVLKDPVTVTISDKGQLAVIENEISKDVTEVRVLNNAGAELPSTGGIGTTVFYVLGGVLVVCAGVLLITKRRMNKNA